MSAHHQNRGGNRRGGNFNRGSGRPTASKSGNPKVDDNPVVQCFRNYAQELDEKHDRYERIVKCSRDITIESKRIIFLLHTVDAKKNNQCKVCLEAKTRLDKLCQTHFVTIAKELQGQDPYQFLRAYTAGLQEFIEAYTFYEYIDLKQISHWSSIQMKLKYTTQTDEASPSDEDDDEAKQVDDKSKIICLLPPLEFLLGVGDLTGEVMRKCINSLGSGDVESCFEHCRFLQELYKGFISISNAKSRDFSHKISTLRQSLLKSENVCYNVKVRGGEAAKWSSTDDFLDEGVFF